MDPDEVIEQYEQHGITQEVEEAIAENPGDFIDYMGEMDEVLAEVVAENI